MWTNELSIPSHATYHRPTIFPDNALCSGFGSFAVRHSHSEDVAVCSAVFTDLKCRLLLLHVHTDAWPGTSTLDAFARARGKCLSLRIPSSFSHPFPGYHGDLFLGSVLDLGLEIQTRSGDYIDRLLIEDAH